jgi:hypothetical protein
MSKSRRIRWAGHAALMGRKDITSKLRKKEPLERPGFRWVDIIKTDLKGDGWGGMDWIDLAQDRDRCRTHVNLAKNLRVP